MTMKNFANKYIAPILGLALALGVYSCASSQKSESQIDERRIPAAENYAKTNLENRIERKTESRTNEDYKVQANSNENPSSIYAEARSNLFSSLTNFNPARIGAMTESDEKIWDDLVKKYGKGEKK